MATKIELSTKQQISEAWTRFCSYRAATESHLQRGRSLNESDVRSVLERLLTDVLGYEPDQIDREADFADFLLVYQGIKLAVVETKDWGAFRNDDVLVSALRQAANYADRHKARYIFTFDANTLVIAERNADKIFVKATVSVDSEEPAEEIFYFTHYGLSKLPKTTKWSIEHSTQTTDPKLFKTHHGVKLPYNSFAYIGDLRDKKTWKLPYLLEDGHSVDTGRIDKAVSYLFSPGGYRGVQSKGKIPEASLPDVAKKLAKAYSQLGNWSKDESLKSVQILWQYLDSRGETALN